MPELVKELFEFAKKADHINAELSKIPATHPDIREVFHLKDSLSVIAREAEFVASELTPK